MDNQKQRVLELLQNKGQNGAYTYDFFKLSIPIIRPAARVNELRKEGYNIITERIDEGNFKYILVPKLGRLEELKKSKALGEKWLKENEDSPLFEKGLKRYEKIDDEIQELRIREGLF